MEVIITSSTKKSQWPGDDFWAHGGLIQREPAGLLELFINGMDKDV
jgi:hypothetical protein